MTMETDAPNPEVAFVRIEQLSSSVYGESNPPKDWADITLLIPHEALRGELAKGCNSIDQLVSNNSSGSPWQVVYFCEWVVDFLLVAILDHHDNEESIFFPWIESRATCDSRERLASDHTTLSQQLIAIRPTCERIIRVEGQCSLKDLEELQSQLHTLKDTMEGETRGLHSICLMESWFSSFSSLQR